MVQLLLSMDALSVGGASPFQFADLLMCQVVRTVVEQQAGLAFPHSTGP